MHTSTVIRQASLYDLQKHLMHLAREQRPRHYLRHGSIKTSLSPQQLCSIIIIWRTPFPNKLDNYSAR